MNRRAFMKASIFSISSGSTKLIMGVEPFSPNSLSASSFCFPVARLGWLTAVMWGSFAKKRASFSAVSERADGDLLVQAVEELALRTRPGG